MHSFNSSIIVVSGPMGAGKSTIASLLASRFDRSAIVNGGAVQQMIVSGLSWPRAEAEMDDAFHTQLRLRLRAACALARTFAAAGYMVALEEQIVEDRVAHLLEDLAGVPFYFVMLAPPFDVVVSRERARGTDNYVRWGSWDDLIHHRTSRIGLWLDTSGQTPEETLHRILEGAAEAFVRP